ncbi:hypothetical protein [Vibrio salinus]|uniref:hypothetical protein n=1 Tax=Vibrio salinus TaxID=2899784 RepID=UPI001E46AFA9|nr:hypothetical protein [Vibrio salinus]MCE0495758.1 hypothetical protein [Vibrio salinus]
MDHVIKDVVDNINATAAALEQHLKVNTPVINPEKNGIQEANLTFHFASQCLQKSWLIYPEASNFSVDGRPKSRKKHARVDLHVIVENRFIMTVEAKKFFDIDSGNGLIEDFKRAQSIKYEHRFDELPHYILLLAITEKDNWEGWWRDSQIDENSSETWKDLSQILESEGIVRSSLAIDDNRKKHYLLYALKQTR